jgi:hypothetical protein
LAIVCWCRILHQYMFELLREWKFMMLLQGLSVMRSTCRNRP